MKRIKNVFNIIFIILLLIPLLFFNWKKDYISEIDNRKLSEFPSLEQINSDTFNNISSFFKDRLGFREEMITLYTNLHKNLLNTLVHPSYIYGKDNYVFFDLYQKSFTDHTSHFVEAIDKVAKYSEARGAQFYVVIDPEKTSVYTEKLPEGTNYNRLWLNTLEEKLTERNIKWIDNADRLKEASNYEMVYNKEYDAGHWNDTGAFYGTNNILELISKDFPNVLPHTKKDFTISEENRQYLPTSKIEVNELVPVYTLNESNIQDLTSEFDPLITRDAQQNHFAYFKNNNETAKNLPKALVFQGSYLNGREKYFEDRFKEYIAIHNYQNIFDIDYYFNIFQPDIVIFEVAEYTIHNQYFSYEKMEGMQLNSPFNTEHTLEQGNKKPVKIEGNLISKVSVEDENEEIEYAYLKSNNKYYDFKKNEKTLQLTLLTTNLNSKDLYIIYKKYNDKQFYTFKVE